MKDIFDFASFNMFYESLNRLEKTVQPEKWSYNQKPPGQKNTRNPILENYIHHTFRRLLEEYQAEPDEAKRQKIIYHTDACACFNTGLFTPNYSKVYGLFYPTNNPQNDKPYFFYGFFHEAHSRLNDVKELPRRANYFSHISDLIYDPTLAIRSSNEHILQENKDRFPDDLRDSPILTALFAGAVDIAQKRVQSNYKVAVPTYYRGEICLLLPLCLRGTSQADLALAVKKNDGFYTAKTCLTLDMAYNDARLIAKPDADWLTP